MTDWLMVSGASLAVTCNEPLTAYLPLNGSPDANWHTAENRNQCVMRDTYTAKNLWCYVSVNGLTLASTLRTRKATANGAQSVSITGSTTGSFEDTTNTDSLVTGNAFNYQFVSTAEVGTPTITIRTISVILSHSANIVPWIAGTSDGGATIAADGYAPVIGVPHFTTPEADIQITARTAVVLSQMRVWVLANTTTEATINLRKNLANGNQTVSVGSGVTGAFVDSVNTDSIAVGDEVDTFCDIISGTSIQFTLVEYEADGAQRHAATRLNGVATPTYTNLSYAPLDGRLGVNVDTTEANVEVKARLTTPFKNLFVYVPTNASTATATVGLRKNNATVISVSIGTLATGVFEETSTTVTPATTDLLNYIIDNSGDVTNAITLTVVSVEQIPAAGGATGTAAATLPHLTSAATGVMLPSGTAVCTLPRLNAAATGQQVYSGTAACTLPKLTTAATGAQGTAGTASCTLPALTASAAGAQVYTGTSIATLPRLTTSAAGAQAQSGTATATLPRLVTSAIGVMQPSGTAVCILPSLRTAAAGAQVYTGTLAATLPHLTTAATGAQTTGGATGTGVLTLPHLTATLSGIVSTAGTVVLVDSLVALAALRDSAVAVLTLVDSAVGVVTLVDSGG